MAKNPITPRSRSAKTLLPPGRATATEIRESLGITRDQHRIAKEAVSKVMGDVASGGVTGHTKRSRQRKAQLIGP